MGQLLTDTHRAWIGRAEPPITVEVSRRDIIKYAIATEQVRADYLAGDAAPPMFIFNLFGPLRRVDELRPDGLAGGGQRGPGLPLKRVMAGGVELKQHRPIRPGDTLTGVSRIVDLYEKDGNSGPLIFTVRELSVSDANGEPVFTERQTGINR